MGSLAGFSYLIRNIVSKIFDSSTGLQGTIEGWKYRGWPYEGIKRFHLKAINLYKPSFRTKFGGTDDSRNMPRTSQREDGVFVVIVPVIVRAFKSIDAPGLPSTSVYIGTTRHNRYLTEDRYSRNVDLAKARAYVQEDIENAEKWIRDIVEVEVGRSSIYAGTPFELRLDVVSYQQAKMLVDD